MTEELRDTIRSGGPIAFERFMDLALYGDQGFYNTGGSAGRRGDFITSPEVGPLFGSVIATWLDAEWERIGRPDPFTVIDAGAGPGTLARSILATPTACRDAMRYVGVEISAGQRAHHPDGVESRGTMPDPIVDGTIDGVVIANELLDNLPFRLAVFDDGWREAFVDIGHDGRFVEVLTDRFDPVPGALPQQMPGAAPFGARAPLIDRAARFVGAARASVRAGSVLCIDYGVNSTAALSGRPWRDWLRTYRGNQRGGHYLEAPGTQDITIDVPLDQLGDADAVRTQAQFLQRWGIDDLVAQGKRVWQEQAARPGLEAMRMRSRVSEAEALLDPTGLGAFVAIEWRA